MVRGLADDGATVLLASFGGQQSSLDEVFLSLTATGFVAEEVAR